MQSKLKTLNLHKVISYALFFCFQLTSITLRIVIKYDVAADDLAMTAQYSLIEAVISALDFCLEVWFLATFLLLVIKLLKMKALKN